MAASDHILENSSALSAEFSNQCWRQGIRSRTGTPHMVAKHERNRFLVAWTGACSRGKAPVWDGGDV
jgi:hypothetical protein